MGRFYKEFIMNNKEILVTLGLVLLSFFLIFYTPLLVIWALNNLFHLDTPYNWKTWISVFILSTLAKTIVSKNEETKIKSFWK